MPERATRLLIVATVPGTVRGFLLPYLDHFRGMGWHVEVATGAGRDVATVAEHADRVHVVGWSRRLVHRANVFSAPLQMRRLISAGGFDLLHSHTPIASFVTRASLAGMRDRPAVVYTAHGFHFHHAGSAANNALYALAERAAAHWTDRLVVINDEDRVAAVARHVMPPEQVVQMPGIGLDLSYYHPTAVTGAGDVRADLGLPDDAVLFTIVAELQPGKNHELALRALHHNPNLRYHLCLAGDGPTRPALERLVVDLDLRSRVHFLGRIDDVRPVVAASDATLLPSRREGLSRAVLESLALGVPVVGSTSRGVRDLIWPGAGILVGPDDLPAMSAALDAVRELPTGGALRALIDSPLQRYGISNLVHLHEELYAELLRARR